MAARNTKTIVVNLHLEAYDVYIGRPGKGLTGFFGNPYFEGTRERNIERFKERFYTRINTEPVFKKRVLELKGKRLGCFCKPRACHGDVIAEYLNNVK